MELEAIKKTPADQQAADALRQKIISGDLAPGARLVEAALAERFALSRGTIRAALHQLSREGLINQIPYTGWTVMVLTTRDVWELFTLRASLESLASRLASEQIDAEGRAALKAAYAALVDASRTRSPAIIAEADFRLHKTIVDLSGHGRLRQQYRLVEQQIRLYIVSSDSKIVDERIVLAHHRAIVDAILAQDAAKAARLAEEHNNSEGKKLVQRIERQLRSSTG